MKLNAQGLADRKQWEEKGYALPQFDRAAVTAATKENPFWIHFGPGNIFRAFQANVVQNLLNAGLLDRGLVVAEGYDYEIVEKMNHPHDDYHILVTLKGNGTVEKTVVGSVVESPFIIAYPTIPPTHPVNDAESSDITPEFVQFSIVVAADLPTIPPRHIGRLPLMLLTLDVIFPEFVHSDISPS